VAEYTLLLALFAFAAPSREEAWRQIGARRIQAARVTGQSATLPGHEATVEFAQQTGVSDYRLEEPHPQVIVCTPRRSPRTRRIARPFRYQGIRD
jgi:hypothetical protein